MIGRLIIDNIDIYSAFGCYVTEHGWNELIAYPPLKPVASNDWYEYDGIEVDLSQPRLDSRTIVIKLATYGGYRQYLNLINFLSVQVYHTFDCAHIGLTYMLRFVGVDDYNQVGDAVTFGLRVSDDYPTMHISDLSPICTISTDNTYRIDDYPLSVYNSRILSGVISNAARLPYVRSNAVIDSKYQSGVIYDSLGVYYTSNNMRIRLHMTADDIQMLWRNYYALLRRLIQPNVHTLYIGCIDTSIDVYYLRSNVVNFYPTDKIWLDFDVELCAIGNVRLSVDNIIRLTQDSNIRILHNGDIRLIN